MIKKFILLALVMCLFGAPAFAGDLFDYTGPEKSIATAKGSTLASGTQLITGRAEVHTVTITGGNTAGEYVVLYDGTSTAGTEKVDVKIGTAYETIPVPLKRSLFGSGVYAKAFNAAGSAPANYYLGVQVEYNQ